MLVLGITTTVYLLTAAYHLGSYDVLAANLASWQLATTGSPVLEPTTFPPLQSHPLSYVWIMERADGSEVIARSPGAVLAAVPAYFLFGQQAFSLIPGAATAAVMTGLSAMLLTLSLRDRLAPKKAALAGLVFGLSTPLWSVAANGMWPHTVTVLGVCGMAWAASRDRWWLVGLFGGVVLWGRLHGAVIVAIFGLAIGWRRKDPVLVLRTGLSSGFLLALQCCWTRWVNGSWNPLAAYNTPFSDVAERQLIDVVNQLGYWVAPDRGILVWTPLILVLTPALVRSWSTLPDWSRALVWAGLTYTVIQGVLNLFHGGDTFYGYRLTLELLACLTPALAMSAPRMGAIARSLFAPVLAVQTMIISVGAIIEGVGLTADRAWNMHSFVWVTSQAPAVGIALVLMALALGFMGRRIWADPSVRHSRARDVVPAEAME